MIFVTVGTHEQPFDRLISHIDELVAAGVIKEEVVVQIGFSNYEPKHCKWSKLLPHKEVKALVEEARIIVTHGGPASFMMPLELEKIPIVVPRRSSFSEHVNDHQVNFCKEVAQRNGNIIFVEDLEQLGETISNYENIVSGMSLENKSHNAKFNEKFIKMVDEMFEEDK